MEIIKLHDSRLSMSVELCQCKTPTSHTTVPQTFSVSKKSALRCHSHKTPKDFEIATNRLPSRDMSLKKRCNVYKKRIRKSKSQGVLAAFASENGPSPLASLPVQADMTFPILPRPPCLGSLEARLVASSMI